MFRWLRIIHLARVPLLTLLSLVLLGPIGYLYAPGMALGLLNMEDWYAFFWASAAIILVQMSAVIALNLVVLYGPLRFADFRIGKKKPEARPKLQAWILGLATLPSIALITTIWWVTPLSAISKTAAVLGAYGLNAALVLFGIYFKGRLSTRGLSVGGSRSLVLPLTGWGVRYIERIKRPSEGFQKLKAFFSPLQKFLIRMMMPFSPGYFIYETKAGKSIPHFRRGHTEAAFLFIISGLLYASVALSENRILRGDGPPSLSIRFLASAPPLAYTLFAIMLACWFFSGLSFFLDKYRIPTLTTFIVVCLVTSTAPESDHFFRVERRGREATGESPSTILSRHRTTPILIAAEGGGIQAAAWTAEVLDRLAKTIPGFKDRIVLISGVSGGAVGAMAVGAEFGDLHTAAKIAAESSLKEVAWGWLATDVWRAMLPWFGDRRIDRGWALERSWEKRLNLSNEYVSGWATKTAGGFPAFIFNTTWVETGEPLVISTSDFPHSRDMGLRGFKEVWKNFDVRISTAARLSASFPFVSPASRPDGYSAFNADRHLVDGGYFDNFGLYSLIGWLSEALTDYTGSNRILVLQIRSFPRPNGNPDTVGTQQQGWFAQLHAPLDTMLHTRTAGQVRQAQALMNSFSENMAERFSILPVDIGYASGGPECQDPPLSWKLTQVQQNCIREAKIRLGEVKLDCIKNFLAEDSKPNDRPLAEYRRKCWSIE